MKIKKKNGGASRRKALKPLYHKIKKSQERVFNQVRTLTLTNPNPNFLECVHHEVVSNSLTNCDIPALVAMKGTN